MATIGHGYGSEWHLLRHLGYHREYLSQKTLQVTDGNSIEWLDFGFSTKNVPLKDDREFVGLDFIQDAQIQNKWKTFWPQTGTAQNWDAIGKIQFDAGAEWLLVEAKGRSDEVNSKCKATNPESKRKIHAALAKTSAAFGNHSQPIENWLGPYYQYANRLATLYFLMKECVPPINARLLFIYFCGENRETCICPQSEQEWTLTIQAITHRLGIDKTCELAQRVHSLFLPVNPAGQGLRLSSK